jgi:hypothetical protein
MTVVWQDCADPHQMLEIVKNRASDRKLRLFGVACCRRGNLLCVDRSLLDMIESYADGLLGAEDLWRAYNLMGDIEPRNLAIPRTFDAWQARRLSAWAASRSKGCQAPALTELDDLDMNPDPPSPLDPEVLADHCRFLRDLFTHLVRKIELKPSWLTVDVCSIARGAYDHPRKEGILDEVRLGVLGDALEDAGCNDPEILGHCRQADAHIRGCWLVDLVLARE